MSEPPRRRESSDRQSPPALVEHFFRHEYGRLVAVLTRRAGVSRIELVEDAVQGALEAALTAWVARGMPDNPSAWLYRVARNNIISALRKDERQRHGVVADVEALAEENETVTPAFAGEVRDDLLRMLFVCCDEGIPEASRLVLALKTLCGFGIAEIAFRLFLTEANAYKRLARARERLREFAPGGETPPLESLRSRLPSVHAVIYLLFNEGHLSSHREYAIRAELCEEAIRLGTLLASHPVGETPETCALLALMHLHAARLASRQDAEGGLLLLEEQDRGRWDAEHLRLGATWLERAARGDEFTRFHAEAGIAAEHCFAPSLAQTRWDAIADLYAMLERIDPSPLHVLNRALAVGEARDARAGLAVLEGVERPRWLYGHYLWDAVLADLQQRAGEPSIAAVHRDRALRAAPSDAVRAALRRRWARGR